MPGWAVWSVPDLQPPGCESVWPPRTPQPGQQIWTITTAIFSSAAVHLHESVQIFDRCSNTQLGPWVPNWVSSDSWALFWPLAPYLSEFRFLISVLAPSSAPGSLTEMLASTLNSARSILALHIRQEYLIYSHASSHSPQTNITKPGLVKKSSAMQNKFNYDVIRHYQRKNWN